MSRKQRFIEKLSKEQKSSLEKGYKAGKPHLYRRKCQCILLSYEGKTIKELCATYGVSRQSIYRWFNQWEAKGIKGLELQPGRGRPPKLRVEDQNQVKMVKILVANEPKNLNRVVAQVKSELGVGLSKKTLKRFLKNLNTDGSDSVED